MDPVEQINSIQFCMLDSLLHAVLQVVYKLFQIYHTHLRMMLHLYATGDFRQSSTPHKLHLGVYLLVVGFPPNQSLRIESCLGWKVCTYVFGLKR